MSTPVPVQKDVPIPQARSANGYDYRAIVESLKVGDSFLLEGLNSSGASSRLARHAKRSRIRLTMRADPKGVRVWRVK